MISIHTVFMFNLFLSLDILLLSKNRLKPTYFKTFPWSLSSVAWEKFFAELVCSRGPRYPLFRRQVESDLAETR